MATTAVGRSAETAVATYLRGQGFKIIKQNWRTRWCEIDVVSRKARTVYFTEVKYRTSHAQGSGFEYIGPKKMRQLRFAVDFWTASNSWSGDCRIMVAEVSGLNFKNISLVEID